MKSILVPVERNDLLEPTLQVALLLAKLFASRIEGFALRPAFTPFMAADAIGATVVYNAEAEHDGEIAEECRRMFEDFMRKNGISSSTGADDIPSYGWTDGNPAGDTYLGNYARVFDVTLIGQPGSLASSPRMSTLEAALFESGRPILIAPPSPPPRLGQDITIAWNRSTETARAIALAMPLLKKARRVTVLSVEGGSVTALRRAGRSAS